MVDATELVSISAAALVLGINKSTLGRYLKEHSHLIEETRGNRKLVDVEKVRQHRVGNVNEAQQQNWSGATPGVSPDGDGETLSAKRAEHLDQDIVYRRMRNAQALGQLVEVARIDDPITEAAEYLKNSVLRMISEQADILASKTSAPEIRRILEQGFAKAFSEFGVELTSKLEREKVGSINDAA